MHRIWMLVDPRRALIALFAFLFTLAIVIHGVLLTTDRYNWLRGDRIGPAPSGPGVARVPIAAQDTSPASTATALAPTTTTLTPNVAGAGTPTNGGAAAPAAASPAAALAMAVYFANNATALDAEGQRVVADAVRQLQQQPAARVAITGYTDATGNLAANQELAKNRAKAVRDALTGAGIDRARIDMRPPAQVQANAAGRERAARRVDLALEQ